MGVDVKTIIAGLLAFALVTIPTNANAVENGVSAEGDPRIVSIYKGYGSPGYISIDFPMCSGYLLSERIVVTAQHCTFDPQRNTFRDASELIIGTPGEKSNRTPGRHFLVSAVFRANGYKGYDQKTDLSYTNDVAVLVLSKPVQKTTRAKLLNETEFMNLLIENPEIWIGGYGLQKQADRSMTNSSRFVIPAKAPAKFANPSDFQAAVSAQKSKWKRTFYQENLVGLEMQVSTGTICDGDSGAGFWLKKDSQDIYLGVMNGPVGISNCFGESVSSQSTFIGVHPTYQYQSLFTKADSYVKKNPVKSVITCKKGKLTKKVNAVNPKCPTGYKKS